MARAAANGRNAVSVRLRAPRRDDAAWLGAWLPAVAAAAGCDELAMPDAASAVIRDRARVVRMIERDGGRAGLLVARAGTPRAGEALLELVAMPPELARRGSGMRAVALLEDELRKSGVRRVYALAPAVHGIAVYFWIRLGYHPLLRPQWPCERAGVAWLSRELD